MLYFFLDKNTYVTIFVLRGLLNFANQSEQSRTTLLSKINYELKNNTASFSKQNKLLLLKFTKSPLMYMSTCWEIPQIFIIITEIVDK